jgi:hypothetical protein
MGTTGIRLGRGAVLSSVIALLSASLASGTIRYGDIQIAGNLESLNLVNVHDGFDLAPIMQRNTFRIQYEHDLVENGRALDGAFELPFVDRLSFFAYYRFVYDSIYDIAPGGALRTQDGGFGGKISDVNGSVRDDVAFENVIREIYADVDFGNLSLRIGRQQIVWGNAVNFRALDTNNPLDLSWHLQQEAGLLGRAGFSELRIPAWGVKALWSFDSVGPLSNNYLEVYDFPFGVQPAKVRFRPHPYGLPLRDPFRGGLVVDPAETFGLPFQACFDTTGNTQPNAAANPDFGDTAETGFCDSAGLPRSRLRQGLWDDDDPTEAHQFGARYGTQLPFGLGVALSYVYKRSSGADIPGATVAKVQLGAVNGNQLGFVSPDLTDRGVPFHTTYDEAARRNSTVLGYVRIPIEFYYPYIHVPGVALDYYDELTQTVYNLELTYQMGVPVATAEQTGNGIHRKDLLIGALLLDRQMWIRWLNPRSTFTTLYQVNFLYLPGHDDIGFDSGGHAVRGDVGLPNAALIPGQFGELDRIDRLKELEIYSVFVLTTFYKGGSLLPLFAWIADWGNAPSMEFQFLLDYYVTNNWILGPGVRIFTNFGRNVDDVLGIGRLSQNDEIQLRMTYQF